MRRDARPRICIAHQTVWIGDAIGNDILGTYKLLARCGYEVTILGQHVHPEIGSRCRVISNVESGEIALDHDLLLYHHSLHWPRGESLIESFAGPVVMKYHNITPAHYFAPYYEDYRASCEQGRTQTARLAALAKIVRWQSDSSYNAGEIRELGVSDDHLGVVPPFNRIDQLFREPRTATYGLEGPFMALFVGRRAPNKGHAHILRTLAAWRDLFPEVELRCRIVGSPDPHLSSYYRELEALESELGIEGRVEWLQHISNAELESIFRSSHIYLNLSEHEGFCVPLIEAQALGMPVITTGVTALGETAGAQQVVVPVPSSQADYDVLAGFAREMCVSPQLRETFVQAGFRNVFYRFASQAIEARFLEDLAPVLESLEA